MARLRSMLDSHFSASASKPTIQRRAKTRAPWLSNEMDWRKLYVITGIMTFSSKLPKVPPKVITASFLITCAPTWMSISHMTGVNLLVMRDEQGCADDDVISPRTIHGTDDSQRMS